MNKIIFNPIFLVALTMISVIFSLSLYKSAQRTRLSTQNLKNLATAVAQMGAEVALLETSIQEAEQPFSQEKIIRDELLMKKPGEYVIQIPEILLQTTAASVPIEHTTAWEEWQKLLDL